MCREVWRLVDSILMQNCEFLVQALETFVRVAVIKFCNLCIYGMHVQEKSWYIQLKRLLEHLLKTSLKISVSVLFQAGVNVRCIRIVDG